MAVQIDRMETAIEIASPTTGATGSTSDRSAPRSDPGRPAAFRDAVMEVLVDEFDQFTRMRGH